MIALYLCPTLHCPHLVQLGAGVLSHLAGRGGVVRVFRPIVAEAAGDPVLDALAEVAGQDPTAAWGATAEELLVNPTAAVGQVISRFRACADGADRVLVLGSEYDCSLAPVEFSWNTRIAANLGVPMVLVVPSDGGPGQTRARIDVALDEADRHWIPVRRHWRLNERHYGDLQGKNKAETLEQYGEEKFMLWRRSYDTPPPVLEKDAEYSQFNDARYADIDEAERPQTECLKDVVARMLPYWEAHIIPDLAAGKTVLITAHGNSLRALVKHLDEISDADIAGLNIPTGIPLFYELDENFKPVTKGGRYLDPEAAKASIEAVKNQGKKK